MLPVREPHPYLADALGRGVLAARVPGQQRRRQPDALRHAQDGRELGRVRRAARRGGGGAGRDPEEGDGDGGAVRRPEERRGVDVDVLVGRAGHADRAGRCVRRGIVGAVGTAGSLRASVQMWWAGRRRLT